MPNWALTLFGLAILAAVLGFSGVSPGASTVGQILFLVFLVAFVGSVLVSPGAGRTPKPPR